MRSRSSSSPAAVLSIGSHLNIFLDFFICRLDRGIGPMLRIGREIQCLLYAGFLNYVVGHETDFVKLWANFEQNCANCGQISFDL